MKRLSSVFLAVLSVSSCLSHAEQIGYQHPGLADPEILEKSMEYSQQFLTENPAVQDMLDKLGFEHLHDLNPGKVYTYNIDTFEVTVSNPSDIEEAASISSFGFGTPVATIGSSGET